MTADRPAGAPAGRRVVIVRLGCARNDVDSEELAGRFAAAGDWSVVAEPADADAVVVNTCGFVESAKQESVDTLLGAAALKRPGGPRAVVAVGCLAERYGEQLAAALPEADAVLGFDHYADLPAQVEQVLSGGRPAAHRPLDRRLLPLSAAPGTRRPARRRLATGPVAALKLASGCDRRCAFCAIPRFRGRYVSRPPEEVLAEAEWLADSGVRELHLVSENSTSYGKDLGDLRSLERLLPQLAAVPGVVRVRLAYLQPAELRPSLVAAIAGTPGVAAYFDLSFQHASAALLRRMRRFGDRQRFLDLLAQVRDLAPQAGVRSNFIVGFPGETRTDHAELERFVGEAGLDAAGFFGYSDEDGTEAAGLPGKVRREVVARRLAAVSSLAEVATADRAADRIGSVVDVLVESVHGRVAEGRAEHQAPETDGSVRLRGGHPAVGDLVRARVTGSDGVDLLATALEPAAAGP